MAKRKPDTSEYLPEWDEGTYQTGSIHPTKPSSSLVVFLLVVVIFLGGICSALGILNIRLLSQLMQAQRETTPMQMDTQPNILPTDNPLEKLQLEAPQVPKHAKVQLLTVESPYYSEKSPNLLSAQQVYEANRQSIVNVLCLTHFGETKQSIGLVLSHDGFLLTNSHAVEAAKRIFITTADGQTYRASLAGSDSFSDLAVLYVQAQDLVPARFSTNLKLQITDPTVAVEADHSLRQSTVFSAGRLFTSKTHSMTLIQTCAGSASGPVFDSFGHVIGYQAGNIASYFSASNIKGSGLVIPTATIAQIVQTLIRDGHVAGRPSLGVQVEEVSKLYQQYWQMPGGLLLTNVKENSNAAINGLQEGDILLALDGQPIQNSRDMYAMLYNCKVGDTVIAVICRADQKFTVTLTVEENSRS